MGRRLIVVEGRHGTAHVSGGAQVPTDAADREARAAGR
jgi:hypothetical protein